MSKASEFSDQLQAEGVPRSPASLDEKILAYARDQVPVANPWRSVPWMTAFAAGSVAVVSILFVLRTPLLEPVDEFMPEAEPALYNPGKPLQSPQSNQQNPSPERRPREAESVQKSLQKAVVAKESTGLKMRQERGLVEGSRLNLDLMVDEAASVMPDDVDALLRGLRRLLAEGRIEEAEAGYLALVKDCRCELPDTLAQALKDFAGREE